MEVEDLDSSKVKLEIQNLFIKIKLLSSQKVLENRSLNMDSPWFSSDNSLKLFSLRDYFKEQNIDQRDILKFCMDITKIAHAIPSLTFSPEAITLDSVKIRGGSLVVISQKVRKDDKRSLRSLAAVANSIASFIDNQYRPEVNSEGNLDSFDNFSQRANSIFKAI